MKLINPKAAGAKLALASGGSLEVDKEGYVVADCEETYEALRAGGFLTSEEYFKAHPELQSSAPKEAPAPAPKTVSTLEPEVVVEDEEDDVEEIEIEDLGELNVKDAIQLIEEEDDEGVLNAWFDEENKGKKRKSVIVAIQKALSGE